MAERLDMLMTKKGLTRSRSEALDLIKRGKVYVDSIQILKASKVFEESVNIQINEEQYVGRGALKLEHALSMCNILVQGRTCIDIGSSTGGFTEVLLKHGAKLVFAIDTGTNQLAEKLTQDSRVVVCEKTDIRTVTRDHLINLICLRQQIDSSTGCINTNTNDSDVTPDANNMLGNISIVVADVSFISLSQIVPSIKHILEQNQKPELTDCIFLVKPQFEVGSHNIGKNGIVKLEDPQIYHEFQHAIQKLRDILTSLGFTYMQMFESPIKGGSGNTEYLLYATYTHVTQ
jgi:23S rRNA (cytidine1920-2'-O)/16S rRNA (cytidine1409-2'-O)-methyltransferase